MTDMSNTEKDPQEWVTGDEPMTGAQRSYLQTLSQEASVEFDDSLSKADASKRTDARQVTTGRAGADAPYGRRPPQPPSGSRARAACGVEPRVRHAVS